MSLKSPETQELKYKKGTIATFGFPLTLFCSKSSQNSTDDMALFFFCDDVFPYQALSIKDNVSSPPLPSRIFFCLPLSFS